MTARRPRRPPRPRGRAARTAQAAMVWDRLAAAYPDARCALAHRNAFELLVATMLSAQCTDARVNLVTPALFARYPDATALAAADRGEVERIIRSTGFFRAKAKALVGMARALVERHGGAVPRTLAELVPLPGVGRKTANVVLGNAFGIDEGMVVDTHIGRLARRLGLTAHTDPPRIERDLMAVVPRDRWTPLAHLLITHGRRTCEARRPRCGACLLADICPTAAA